MSDELVFDPSTDDDVPTPVEVDAGLGPADRLKQPPGNLAAPELTIEGPQIVVEDGVGNFRRR